MVTIREDFQIVDLTREMADLLEQTAVLLFNAFHNRTEDWQDLASARQEVMESLASERISRVTVDPSGKVLGWIGAIPMYRGRVWELHPIVVAQSHRRRGIGSALVQDLERIVASRGAVTLWLGSDDENDETTLSGIDLYADIPGAIRNLRRIRGEHPCEFYLRLGFRVTGVMPDANGPGKPDIFFAKRVAANIA
jgi:aminoglycoside 6'-N-acetyltransferase I